MLYFFLFDNQNCNNCTGNQSNADSRDQDPDYGRAVPNTNDRITAKVVGYEGNRSVSVNSRFTRSYVSFIINVDNLKSIEITGVFGSRESNI